MKTYETPYVSCAFDPSHSMPITTLPYHQQKCEKAYKLSNPGAKVFHCKHYYTHILFSEQELAKHQDVDCSHHPQKIKQRNEETVRGY